MQDVFRRLKIVLIVILFPLVLTPQIALGDPHSQVSLKDQWTKFLQRPSTGYSLFVLLEALQKHFVFVDGLCNELAAPGNLYFYDNIQELTRIGITVSHLRYSSSNSFVENSALLVHDIENISNEVQKPIVVVSHSMGANQAFFGVLNRPDLMLPDSSGKTKIEKLVLIQPAIGGSPLSNQFYFWAWEVKSWLGNGLLSLFPDYARKAFSDAFEQFETKLFEKFGSDQVISKFQSISKRIFYIRSFVPNGRSLSWGLKIVQHFLSVGVLDGFMSDGLLLVEDQKLDLVSKFRPGMTLGTDLDVLEADHIELVVSSVSRSSSEWRKMFTRALVETIFSQEEPSNVTHGGRTNGDPPEKWDEDEYQLLRFMMLGR